MVQEAYVQSVVTRSVGDSMGLRGISKARYRGCVSRSTTK